MEGPLLGCLPGFPSSLWRRETCWGTQDPPGEPSPPRGSGSKVSFSGDICSPPSLSSQAVPSFSFLPQVWLSVGLGEMGHLTPAQVSTDIGAKVVLLWLHRHLELLPPPPRTPALSPLPPG